MLRTFLNRLLNSAMDEFACPGLCDATYHADNELGGSQQNMGAAYKTLLSGQANTTGLKSYRLYAFNIGPSGLPASTDCEWQFDIQRLTAGGTGGAIVVANPNDKNEAAASSTWRANETGEGTYTANSGLKYIAMNQRGTHSWITNDWRQMPMTPATTGNGLGARAKSSTYASTMGCSFEFEE